MKRFVVPLLLVTFALGGCSGTEDRAAPAPSASADQVTQMRAYAKCMRANGVDMPDPTGEGMPGLPAMKVGSPEMKTIEAASEKCRDLLPVGAAGDPPKPSAEELEKSRAQAKCFRENGLPNFPDPDPETGAVPMDPSVPLSRDKMLAATKKCGGTMPAIQVG
ncbi:hypothetical protein AB0M54_06015 [Actinoplanes sp. NPDC051470]|uniref:hypothetical protein n=1 Tax=unclassified Actinoplanes TaxID=2626549 RepID=UPI003423F4EC